MNFKKLSCFLFILILEVFTSCESHKNSIQQGSLEVGDAYQGGKVAYILQAGDPGYDANVQHGLIAAITDRNTDAVWAGPAYQNTSVPGTETKLGSGSANTDKIIAQNGVDSSYAASIARAYTGGGYHDWYLPSKDELDKLYINRIAIGSFGSFLNYYRYWSSSESSRSVPDAWLQYFITGNQYIHSKSRMGSVRPIRAF